MVQESNTGRKTGYSKSNMSRYFVTVFFFSTVIKFYSPVKKRPLFEQGTMSTIIT